MQKCSSGKVLYLSQSIAEDALIESWIRNNYRIGTGPVNVYKCDNCGNYHFTSKGEMNVRLKVQLDNGEMTRSRTAFNFERKFRR